MSFSLLVPAAGSGERLGGELPKALVNVCGEPMFVRAVRPFLEIDECAEVIVAAPSEYLERYALASGIAFGERVRVVAGGGTRQESVGLALRATASSQSEYVLVHDAARPMVTAQVIWAVLNAFSSSVAAVLPGVPIVDTLKRAQGQPPEVCETISRERLFAVQTPQAVRSGLFREAHRMADQLGVQVTDDVSLIERFDLGAVVICEGDASNFKVTTPTDLARAREYFSRT